MYGGCGCILPRIGSSLLMLGVRAFPRSFSITPTFGHVRREDGKHEEFIVHDPTFPLVTVLLTEDNTVNSYSGLIKAHKLCAHRCIKYVA